MFQVYDLRQQGLSFPEIAQQLWPKAFEDNRLLHPYPEKNPSVQKAYSLYKTAKKLIQERTPRRSLYQK